MTTTEIEREDVGTRKRYYVVYRHKTYEDGETIIQSCILLPTGHPLFGVSEEAEGLRSRFPLPLLTAGQGTRMGIKDDSWWLVFGDLAKLDHGIDTLPFEDIKRLAIPQIVAALEEAEANPTGFLRPRGDREADA
jgi:hypothetical protein